MNRTDRKSRETRFRDARLFVVAVEGARTEPRYFEALKEREIIDPHRVKLEVLPTEDGLSAPGHVVDRLANAIARYELRDFDERWVVLDHDARRAKELSDAASRVIALNGTMAMSAPCFEAWLLLHVANDFGGHQSCDDFDHAFRAASGGFEPGGQMPKAIDRAAVERACERARQLDPSPGQRWPQSIGTHVYHLVERLLRRAVSGT